MKKLITGILATLAVCSCFAGCDLLGGKKKNPTSSSPDPEPTPAEANVEGAADYLEAMYNDHEAEGRADYERITSLLWPAIDGHTYKVEWSVDVDADFVEIEAIDGEDKVLVNVDEQSEVEKDYVLTAKVSYEDKSATTDFNYKLVKGPTIVPQAITAAPEVGTDYLLYMYQVTKKADEYYTGTKTSTGFYLSTSLDYEDAVAVNVESAGTDLYYLTSTVDGTKSYIGVENVYSTESTPARWHNNILLTETNTVESGKTATYKFKYNADYQTMTATLTGVKAGEDANTTETSTKHFYLGTYSTYYTFGVSDLEKITNEDSCIGKLVTMVNKVDFDETERIADEKAKTVELIKSEFWGDDSYKLPKRGQLFSNVKIAWAVKEGASAKIEGNKLVLTNPTEACDVVLKATLTCGEATPVEAEVTIKHNVAIEEISIPEAIALGSALESNKYTAEEHKVTGTVVNIASTTYGNMTIADENGNNIYVYGVYNKLGDRYDKMANKPVLGDTVTLQAVIGNYYGAVQMKDAVVQNITLAPETMSDVHQILVDLCSISIDDIIKTGSVDLPTAGTANTNVAITWASDNAVADVTTTPGKLAVATLPAKDTYVKLTATGTLGSATASYVIEVKVGHALAEGEIIFAYFEAGTQYAENEVHTINDTLTVTTNKAHFTSQLRLYGNTASAVIASTKVIDAIKLSVGYKKDTLVVWGSVDGATYTQIQEVSITSTSYKNYTVNITDSTYKYIKLSVKGTNQLRVESINLTFAA